MIRIPFQSLVDQSNTYQYNFEPIYSFVTHRRYIYSFDEYVHVIQERVRARFNIFISHPKKKRYTSIRTLSTPLTRSPKPKIQSHKCHIKENSNTKKTKYNIHNLRTAREISARAFSLPWDIFDLVNSQHDFLWTMSSVKTYNDKINKLNLLYIRVCLYRICILQDALMSYYY